MYRSILTATAAAATVFALVGTPAQAVDNDVVLTLPEASSQTTKANLVHVKDVASQTNDNISCRVEAPAFVAQPEVDGRVTVKGEDTAVAAAECADLQLAANYQLTLKMTLEYFDPRSRAWVPILDSSGVAVQRVCSQPSLKGVAAVQCVLDEVLTANNPASGKLHRVGAQLLSPKTFAPLYTESPLGTLGLNVKQPRPIG